MNCKLIKHQSKMKMGITGVPKGSHVSNPDGSCRMLEFRKALKHIGLRVVLDVVYYHLYGSGPYGEASVFRKNMVSKSSFTNLKRETFSYWNLNHAFIHLYCVGEYLKIHSSCKYLALAYSHEQHRDVDHGLSGMAVHLILKSKVDGFRFDLMGHKMKSTLVKAKSVLNSLSRDKCGVDGYFIYIYGEGWDFDEVGLKKGAGSMRQSNLCGTGIGRLFWWVSYSGRERGGGFKIHLCGKYLAQNRYFEDEAFIGYLKYLQYWQRPEYIKFIMYPHCLFFLELLQNANFRVAMAHPANKELAHRQQFFFWKNYRNNRLKHILPRPLPEPSTAPPPLALPPPPAIPVSALPPVSAPSPSLSPMQYGLPTGSSMAKNDLRNSGVDRRKRKKEA